MSIDWDGHLCLCQMDVCEGGAERMGYVCCLIPGRAELWGCPGCVYLGMGNVHGCECGPVCTEPHVPKHACHCAWLVCEETSLSPPGAGLLVAG